SYYSSPETTIYITGRLSVWIDRFRPVTDQTTGGHEKAEWINCRQAVARRKRDDQLTIVDRQRSWHRDQTAIRCACKISDGAFNILGVSPAKGCHLHSKGA